jgi:N-terminal half of MaoC dehydratase
VTNGSTHVSAISPQMREAVGGELARRVSFPVSESDIRRWALAVHYPERPPREYWDGDYAAAGGHGGIVAPLDFNPFAWLTAQPGFDGPEVDNNDPDKTEKTLDIPGPGLKFMLNGGMSATYGVRMRPGDVITSVSRLGSYTERLGRLGLMLFTTFVDEWTNQDARLVKRSTTTLIRY